MYPMIVLKVTKNQCSTISLKKSFFKRPGGGGGGERHIDPTSTFLGLVLHCDAEKTCFIEVTYMSIHINIYTYISTHKHT